MIVHNHYNKSITTLTDPTMNRNDIPFGKDIIQELTNTSTFTFPLTTALRMYLHENTTSHQTREASCHHAGRLPRSVTGEEYRLQNEEPTNLHKMQTRIRGLRRYAASSLSSETRNPTDLHRGEMMRKQPYGHASTKFPSTGPDNKYQPEYRGIHSKRAVALQKKEARLERMKQHGKHRAVTNVDQDYCYRTTHPNKLISMANMQQRIHGLQQRYDPNVRPSRKDDASYQHLYRTMHPSKMQSLALLPPGPQAKNSIIQHELDKQEDMIQTQCRGLQKRYQLVHSDLGKLLRSTSSSRVSTCARSSSPRAPSA